MFVAVADSRSCFMRKSKCLKIAVFRSRLVWQLRGVGVMVCESSGVWNLRCLELAMCRSLL